MSSFILFSVGPNVCGLSCPLYVQFCMSKLSGLHVTVVVVLSFDSVCSAFVRYIMS